MKMILKNIRDFAKNHTGFFFLMIFSVLASSVIMLFGFGAYQNFKQAKEETYESQKTFSVSFYKSDLETGSTEIYNVKKSEVMQCIESLDESTLKRINLIYSMSIDETGTIGFIDSRFIYKNGKYLGSQRVADNLRKGVFSGRYYTDYEYSTGQLLAITQKQMLNENGKLELQGKEYDVVMTINNATDIIYTSLSPDTIAQEIAFYFDYPPTSKQYNDIADTFKNILGDRAVLNPPEPYSRENYYLYDTIIMVSVMIAVAASVNITVLYYYILIKRQKSLAIFMLCGCTKKKAVLMYLGESLLLTVPLFVLCSVIFHYILMPTLENTALPFIASAYSFKLYALAFFIYICACALGMLILSAVMVKNQSIVEMKGGGI